MNGPSNLIYCICDFITIFRNIQFQLQGTAITKTFLDDVVEYFRNNLNIDNSSPCQDAYNMIIILETLSDDLSLTLDTDESYNLETTASGKFKSK